MYVPPAWLWSTQLQVEAISVNELEVLASNRFSPKIYADYVACFFEKEKRGVINIKLRPYYRFLQTPFKQLYNVHTLSILTVPTNYSCTIHYINSRGLQFSKLDRIQTEIDRYLKK